MVVAVKTLHGLGYVHSDLKMGNICAAVQPNEQLAFTMIDFGVSAKVTNRNRSENFRGNYLYSSANHLGTGQANELDDMFSLVCIAYKFVYKQLPWEKIEEVKQDLTFLNTA